MADRTEQILAALIKRTTSRDARWEATSTREQFALKLQSGTIVIRQLPDGVFRLRVLNERGDPVLEVEDAQDETHSTALVELWHAVMENYFKITTTLDGVLNELVKDPSIADDVEDDDLPF